MRTQKSQGVLEFAIALPILLLLVFGIIDFSLLFSAWLLIQNISRQAVRYAVTGEYNAANCTAGCSDESDQDAARLQSIRDEAMDFTAGLLLDGAAIVSEPGYMRITICSGRDLDNNGSGDFVAWYPRMGSATEYGECTPYEDAGGPGDPVVVMVDFNHPYITPFLNDIWPMVHLASYHQGIVEQFRVSRLINLPPEIGVPTPTPSNTFTPSITSSPTETFTPSTTATNTFTPTYTPTNTPSPTPDCSLFELSDFWQAFWGTGLPVARITIANNSSQDTQIARVDFYWTAYDVSNPGQTLDRILYDNSSITGTDDTASPTVWSTTGGPYLTAGEVDQFDFQFKYLDSSWPGIVPADSFALIVTLRNGCIVEIEAQPTPTRTITNTPTRTFTPSNTVPTSTRTLTSTPSRTYTRTSTLPSSTFTVTRTPTRTYTPTSTQPTFTPSRTFTPTNTLPTRTFTPSLTATQTYTRTATVPTSTVTRTPTRSNTPITPTRTPTPTITYTPTKTPTRTVTPTFTPATPTPTRTPTKSLTPTPSNTICFDC